MPFFRRLRGFRRVGVVVSAIVSVVVATKVVSLVSIFPPTTERVLFNNISFT